MEIWFGQVDSQHAENERGPVPPQPLHHLDGPHQEEISRNKGQTFMWFHSNPPPS